MDTMIKYFLLLLGLLVPLQDTYAEERKQAEFAEVVVKSTPLLSRATKRSPEIRKAAKGARFLVVKKQKKFVRVKVKKKQDAFVSMRDVKIVSSTVVTHSEANFQDSLIRAAVGNLFKLIEGSMGALIMVVAGLVAIIAAATGGYRAAVGMLVVAVGAFILRALVSLFFGTAYQDFTTVIQSQPAIEAQQVQSGVNSKIKSF